MYKNCITGKNSDHWGPHCWDPHWSLELGARAHLNMKGGGHECSRPLYSMYIAKRRIVGSGSPFVGVPVVGSTEIKHLSPFLWMDKKCPLWVIPFKTSSYDVNVNRPFRWGEKLNEYKGSLYTETILGGFHGFFNKLSYMFLVTFFYYETF